MHRVVTSTDLGEGRIRFRVHIESDQCELASGLEEPTKRVLLQNFADNPALLTCGMTPFQTLKMSHNGMVWIVEAEAIVEPTNAKELRSTQQAQEGRNKS
jgi:hypothetical protein